MRRQLIAGMPNSGKSTFIAALRHLLLAKQVDSKLEITELSDEEGHLSRLEEKWLACETIDRTKPATEGWVQLKIMDTETKIASELSIPDLRGEAFEQPACMGKCHPDLLRALQESDGLLLFSNADRNDDNLLIEDLQDMFPPEGDEGDDDGALIEPTLPFRAENMPEEVKIIEFLQVANRRPRPAKKRRIAVLISAWDVVSEQNSDTPPEIWFAENRPMLSQFLEANSELWDAKIYGVSALGGRLPRDKELLERIKHPSERIRIVGHGALPHDLSAPLHWLISS
ncbi:hypothetical protein [Herbaspirillum huttiense]|uniref:TRAFAC clade GTPase domain-containing protein n=1 Tax=Herbaspirillum huttiense TaxID=863372 RepID=UPI0031E24949